MNATKKDEGLTRKELVEATGCPPYLIAYYSQCGYLPIIRPSKGPGMPILYHPSPLEVIKRRMIEQNRKSHNLQREQ